MQLDSFPRSLGAGIIGAVIAVVVVFFIADAASGPLLATQPGGDGAEEVPLGGAIFGVIFGGIVGGVLAQIARRLSRPVEIFGGICVLGLVLYGIFAFSAAESFSTGLWLNVMHLVAAVPIVGLLVRWLQASSAPTPTAD